MYIFHLLACWLVTFWSPGLNKVIWDWRSRASHHYVRKFIIMCNIFYYINEMNESNRRNIVVSVEALGLAYKNINLFEHAPKVQ